jgi:energy-coupling factor transporter transmembrane protein EcfT
MATNPRYPPKQQPWHRNPAIHVVSFFACVAVAFLLGLGFVFAGDDGSATIGVVVFITEDLGFVTQL